MRFPNTVLSLLLAGSLVMAAEPPAPPAFTKKPTAAKAGEKVRIDFAVDRETDVTVTVEDGNGKVVRHLVSGVLGKNPPAPLKPGLAQSIEWDGKADYGKPLPSVASGGGGFKVRVALGLGARYDKVVMGDPLSIGGVHAMAVGPDGTLYAVVSAGANVFHWVSQRLVALNRDGTFQRTLVPPPANATKDQLEALGGTPVQVGGRTVPMYLYLPERRNTAFWSNEGGAVTTDGKFLTLHPDTRIGLVDLTDAKTPPALLGPKLLPGVPAASFQTEGPRQYLAASGDSKYAYFSGIAPKRSYQGAMTPPYPAVYRVKLPERSPAEPFFGDPAKTGSDETHLGGIAHGMAADGQGNLLICDPVNKRVMVVAEADGKFAGSFPADNPEFVAANRETGEIYLLTLAKGDAADVVKLSSWKNPKPVATAHLSRSDIYSKWRFAVDTSAKPAVLWASDTRKLLRFEDLGDKFSDAKPIGGADLGDGGFVNLTVDHYRDDPEIYVRGGRVGPWARYNEKTGQRDDLKNLRFNSGSAGYCLEVAPNGNLYASAYPHYLHKWDHNGNPLKWDVAYKLPEGIKPFSDAPYDSAATSNAIYAEGEMTTMTHTLGIRGDGRIFKFNCLAGNRGPRALYEYLPSGEKLPTPIVWKVSDNCFGPRFDPAGNIYIAEQVRPADQPIPPEFAASVGPVTTKSTWEGSDPKRTIAIMYGSIIKFSPKGGMVDWAGGAGGVKGKPFDGEPKLDPSLKTVAMGAIVDTSDNTNAYVTAKVIGAEWVHFGISPVPLFYCNCENTRFDVDPFGRVWYPDLGRYRVGVLDTNGNEICHFGGYGNAESCGPDSPVVDPKTGKVRARRADDPKDLKSPFAEPEIAFSYLIGVGATDKYAYMGDSLNRRLLRARLVYAAEESAEIR